MEKFCQMDVVKTILSKKGEIWAKARIPVAENRTIVQKMESL